MVEKDHVSNTKNSAKPRLSFWQIWNMSFGFLGIQFGFALQNANVSRIFQTLGAEIDAIPILWIAAPVTGLIIQPIIGHMSDKTWNRFGRRRPYFLVGAILASAALFVMPNSPVLWIAAGMLWIMDASINITMEPFRAFVGDMLPSSQRTAGFAMQSFFIGTGAVVASYLPYILANWIGIPNMAEEGMVPLHIKWSFYIGAAVFFIAVLWTVISTREYSPGEMEAFEQSAETEDKDQGIVHYDPAPISAGFFYRRSWIWILIGLVSSYLVYSLNWDKELYIMTVGALVFGIVQLLTGLLTKRGNTQSGFVEVINDLFKMPRTMGQLAFVQFFSWFALFSMWIYTTGAVTSHIFGSDDPTTQAYNDGADWVGNAFAVYNGVAALIAFTLAPLSKVIGRKWVHMGALIIGGISLASIMLIQNKWMLFVSMIGVGIAWASILAIPYAILTGSLPRKKFGVYMGIFNFFIVIPQITAASILGFMVRNFYGGEAIYALLTGGVSFLIAAVLITFVQDEDEER